MDYIVRHYHKDLALAWAIRLEGKTDQERFEELGWGLPREIRESDSETYFTGGFVPGITGISMTLINVLEITGPPASPERLAMAGRPGQFPAQLVAHTLFYFTQEEDLVFDPMAGGGVVPDTCLAFRVNLRFK